MTPVKPKPMPQLTMPKKTKASPPKPIASKPANKIAPKIALGMITAAHGIQGWVKIKPFTATATDIANYGEVVTAHGTRHTLTLDTNKHNPSHIIARLSGVHDRTTAAALANTTLYIDRNQLPDDNDSWYHADLLGAVVCDAQGVAIGEATGFYDFGAGELVEVALYNNTLYNNDNNADTNTDNDNEAHKAGDKKVLLPFTPHHRLAIDPAQRRMTLAIDRFWLDDSPNLQVESWAKSQAKLQARPQVKSTAKQNPSTRKVKP